jgi:predicted dehydrogenase
MTWGVVGTGAMSARFAVAARAAGTRVVAVSSRRLDVGRDFARRFGIDHSVDSVSALAALPDVRAIYVATPNERHAIDTMAAIAAGKPVLCEKPFAVSESEAREVVQAARAAGVFCMEGLWSLTLPTYRAGFESVARGSIGRLREFHGDFSVPQNPAAMPRLFSPMGGGALLDRGVYLLSLTHALMGELTLVDAECDLTSDGVDLAATLILRSAEGARAVLTCAIDRMGENRVALLGDRGRIIFEESAPNPAGWRLERIDPEARFVGPAGYPGPAGKFKAAILGQPRLRHVAKSVLHGPAGRRGGLEDEIAHVEDCLRQGKTESDLAPLDRTLAVLALIDQARAARPARAV